MPRSLFWALEHRVIHVYHYLLAYSDYGISYGMVNGTVSTVKKGAVIDTTQPRSLINIIGPPSSLFGTKKKGATIFWGRILAPQDGRRHVCFSYKKGHPFLPRSLFSTLAFWPFSGRFPPQHAPKGPGFGHMNR